MKICDLTQFYSPVSGGVRRYIEQKSAFVRNHRPDCEHIIIVPGESTASSGDEKVRVYTIASPLVSRTSRYRALTKLHLIEEALEKERPDIIESGDPYEREIHATRDALMARIGEIPGGYTLAYQSRTGPVKWLEPPLKAVLESMTGRDVIVVPMSFVTEHIETLHELDIEYRHVADKAGLRTYLRVPAPGTDAAYIRCLTRRVLEILP